MQVLKTMTRCDLKLSCDLTFNCGKIFVERCPQEFIFKEKDLFKLSENKNPSKIMCYTVLYLEAARVVELPLTHST